MNPDPIMSSDAHASVSPNRRIADFLRPAPGPIPMVRIGSHGRWEPLAKAGTVIAQHGKDACDKSARTWIAIAQSSPDGFNRAWSKTAAWLRDERGTERVDTQYGVLRKFTNEEKVSGTHAVDQAKRCEKFGRRHAWRRFRRSLTVGVGVVAFAGELHLVHELPWYHEVLLSSGEAFAGITAFGLYGNGNVAETVRRIALPNRINDEKLRKSLRGLGIGALRRDLEQERPDTRICHFVRDRQRDTMSTTVELPEGVDVQQVINRRRTLAANLRRSESQVVLEEGRGAHELSITIYRSDPSARAAECWPLANHELNIFSPIPLGVNARGDVVTYDFAESNLFIAGKSRAGKSVTMQTLACSALLDPRAELMVWNGKKAPTFAFIRDLCRVYVNGNAAHEQDVCDRGLALLEWLNRECSARGDILDRIHAEKVTNELAHVDGLHPVVVFMDEIQFLFMNSKVGARALTEARKLANQCLAYGIMLVHATQTFDNDAVPWGYVALFQKKIGHQLAKASDNQGLFGDDYAGRGINGCKIRTKGEAILDGEGDSHQSLRVYFVDETKRSEVVRRASFMRAGKVTTIDLQPSNRAGTTIDRPRQTEGRSLLADIFATREGDETGVWMSEVCERLALISDNWANVDRQSIKEVMLTIGIKPRSLKKNGRVRDGYHFELDIKPALELAEVA